MLGVMALASCNKQAEAGYPYRDGEICFSSKGLTITKAVTESTAAVLEANGFKAAVVHDEDNGVMFNKKLSCNNGVYSVAGETYYFPLCGTVSAYAAYPESEVITIQNGVATLDYEQDCTKDLIAAKSTGITKQKEAIDLTFEHVLSQVSFKAKGSDVNADYKLRTIEVTAPDGGTYQYADGTWTGLGEAAAYTAYTNAGAAVSTSDFQAYGESMTFIPGDVRIRVEWDCYNKIDGTLICSYNQSIGTSFMQGEHSTVKLLLPNDAAIVLMSAMDVNAWDVGDKDLDIKELMRLELEAAKLAACTAIDETVGDSEDEYVLAAAVVAKDSVNAAGTIDDVEARKADGISLVNATKESLPGVFTVNDQGKKVRFSKGNLYWNGARFVIEDQQYSYPTTRNERHVGHFFYSKNADVARAAEYNDDSKSHTDILFAANGGAINGYTVLTKDEWKYLMDHSMQSKEAVTIADIKCVILVPDGYTGSVESTYSASEWEAEEADGLVALTYSGEFTGNSSLSYKNLKGYFWTCNPNEGNSLYSWYASFDSNGTRISDFHKRDSRIAIRLVVPLN